MASLDVPKSIFTNKNHRMGAVAMWPSDGKATQQLGGKCHNPNRQDMEVPEGQAGRPAAARQEL